MIYGYARVSTNGQAKDGNSWEAQHSALIENGAIQIFKDKFTGKAKHRPEFDKLFNILQSGDTFIVTKIDRFARSVNHGTQLIAELLERGVKINVLNLGIIDNSESSTSKLIRNILLSIAEWERDMILERTREGKEIARLNPNYREGRPKKELPNFQKIFQKQKDGEITILEGCTLLGISKTQWYRCVKEAV